jgi:hypothetical protein
VFRLQEKEVDKSWLKISNLWSKFQRKAQVGRISWYTNTLEDRCSVIWIKRRVQEAHETTLRSLGTRLRTAKLPLAPVTGRMDLLIH